MTSTPSPLGEPIDVPLAATNAVRKGVMRRALRSLLRARWPILAMVILAVVTFCAVAGPSIAPLDPNRQSIINRLKEPMTPNRQGVVVL